MNAPVPRVHADAFIAFLGLFAYLGIGGYCFRMSRDG